MAGLNEVELATFASYFLAIHVAYTVAYITTSSQPPTFIRSGLWIAGFSQCIRIITRAAAALSNIA
jgi:hypothetical protein